MGRSCLSFFSSCPCGGFPSALRLSNPASVTINQVKVSIMAWLLLLASLILAWLVLPRWRLRLIQKQAFPLHYSRILRQRLPWYKHMPTHLQLQLKQHIKRFLFEKTFVGCDGLVINDEIRVCIAARACLLQLNRETELYPKLSHILVYPGAFVVRRQQQQAGGIISEQSQGLSGESWSDGRVILAWDQINHPDLPGQDVVIHEFAHQLDSENGSTNGAPILTSSGAYQHWSDVMSAAYQHLCEKTARGEADVIDAYGCTNPAEFFAVSCEAFFCKSAALAEAHPQLYDLLRHYFKVEPREWLA